MNKLVAAAFLINIILFARSMPRFTAPNGWSLPMRLLSVCGLIGAAIDLWFVMNAPSGRLRQLLALMLATVASVLFYEASRVAHRHRFAIAFSVTAPEKLIVEGVYRWLRHPLYLSYALNWMAAAIGSVAIQPLAVMALLSGFYIRAAIAENRQLRNLRSQVV